MKKIGIVGAGFVGSAVDFGFNKDVQKFLVDPKLNTSLVDLKKFNPDFIFICVPTPMDKNGKQDSSIIKSVLKEISSLFSTTLVIVKSTVLPNTIKNLSELCPNFVYNPEFLREKTAKEDFINQTTLILGGPANLTKKVSDLYNECTPCKISNLLQTDIVAAALAKYTINSFLASKVIFFNQLKNVFDFSETDESWANFIKIVSSDNRIGNSHMDVPGHDGRYGFGGACFPKDTSALLNLSDSYDQEFSLLKEVIKVNNGIRSKYANMEAREMEQSVSFDFNLD
jgi:nucleotide sugar dehydrogenase